MNVIKTITSITFITALCMSVSCYAGETNTGQEKSKDKKESASSWPNYSRDELQEVERYAQFYKDYIYKVPTELRFVAATIKRVEKQGFKRLTETSNLKPGARFYV